MKKILLSTALLSATAGMAAAEITLSGSGRFGLQYVEGRAQETQLEFRFRTEFNGKVETDSGVTFGGRVRLQSSSTGGSGGGATLSAAYLSASYEGLTVQVGNANGAADSVKLAYNSEIGYTGFGAGDPINMGSGFSSGPYAGTPDRVGIFVAYSVGDLNVRASYHTNDQASAGAGVVDEYSVSADYVFGAVTVAAAYMNNPGRVDDTDGYFLGAEYAIGDAGNIGLLYFDENGVTSATDSNKVTLYGNYTFDAITVRAFVSSGDNLGTEDTAYGLGVDYDLGGAKLAAGVQQDFAGQTQAEVGVSFGF